MTARIVIRSGTVLDRSGARRADVAAESLVGNKNFGHSFGQQCRAGR